MAGITRLTRGGVYLARLDPAKGAEVGKLRPVVVLTDQSLLDVSPPHVFVCPLSGRSDPDYQALHLMLPARDGPIENSRKLAHQTICEAGVFSAVEALLQREHDKPTGEGAAGVGQPGKFVGEDQEPGR